MHDYWLEIVSILFLSHKLECYYKKSDNTLIVIRGRFINFNRGNLKKQVFSELVYADSISNWADLRIYNCLLKIEILISTSNL